MLMLQENLDDARQSKGGVLMQGLGKPVTGISGQGVRLDRDTTSNVQSLQSFPLIALDLSKSEELTKPKHKQISS